MRLPFAFLALYLLLAGCGGATNSSASPATTPAAGSVAAAPSESVSETLPTCRANDLYAAFSGPNGAGAHNYYTFGITNVSVSECTLLGPPVPRFLDSDGSELTIPLTDGMACTGTEGEGCISVGSDQLRPGQPTPYFSFASSSRPASGQQGQVSLTFVVPVSGLYPDCANPIPATIGLVFPGVAGELHASIPQGYASGDCWHDVELLGYGPSATGISPTTLARACTLADLAGGFLNTQGAAGTAYAEFAVANTGSANCSLPGPPVVHVEDDAGNTVGLEGGELLCDGLHSTCVEPGPVLLPSGGATPTEGPAQPGEVHLVLSIRTGVTLVPPCASPMVVARVLVIRFTGIYGELRIPFGGPHEVDLGPCPPQFSLIGYP